MSVTAGFALPAGDRWLDGNQLPNFQTLHPLAKISDPGRELVSHNDWCGHHLVADTAFQVIVYI